MRRFQLFLIFPFAAAFLLSCGAPIFGPDLVSETDGLYGDPDTSLKRAAALYAGAKGPEKKNKLKGARILYSNLLRRSDLPAEKRNASARGLAPVNLEISIDNSGSIIEGFVDMIGSFDPGTFTVDPGKAAVFQKVSADFTNAVTGAFDLISGTIPPADRTESDYANLSILGVVGAGGDLAGFMGKTAANAQKLSAVTSDFNQFLSALSSYHSGSATAASVSNAAQSVRSSVASATIAVAGIKSDTRHLVASIGLILDKVARETKGAKNVVSGLINQEMGIIRSSLAVLTAAFDQLETVGSDLNAWL